MFQTFVVGPKQAGVVCRKASGERGLLRTDLLHWMAASRIAPYLPDEEIQSSVKFLSLLFSDGQTIKFQEDTDRAMGKLSGSSHQ